MSEAEEETQGAPSPDTAALSGSQKAVLMLLSMEEATAVPVLSELSPEEVKTLREAAEGLRSVPVRQLGEVYAEFITKAQTALAVPRGGVRYLEQIASRALGPAETDVIFQEKPRSSLKRLEAAEPTAIAAVGGQVDANCGVLCPVAPRQHRQPKHATR